jgi:carbamoyl-phosphate synthase large subunit
MLLLLDNWHGVARLPGALRGAGFEVGLISEPQFIAAKSRYVDRHFAISMRDLRRGRLKPIWDALEDFAPDFLIPGDEYAVRFVQFALGREHLAGMSPDIRRLLERSVGRRAVLNPIGRRARMLDLAASLGLDCPAHQVVHNLSQATVFADFHGWPVYLKRDHSSGGYWVRQCADRAALADAYRYLTGSDSRPLSFNTLHLLPKHLARAVVFRANPIAVPSREAAVTVEASIPGQPAYHTATALEGRWLTGISAEVEDYYPRPTGPSTRVRLHSDAAMNEAAAKLIAALDYSGFCGLDFIRRPDGGLTFLEFNARPTPVAHLGGLTGADLCTALHRALLGANASPAAPMPDVRVALFPQDWRREPASSDRGGLHLDIPRDDPALLAAFSPVLPAGWDGRGPQDDEGRQ